MEPPSDAGADAPTVVEHDGDDVESERPRKRARSADGVSPSDELAGGSASAGVEGEDGAEATDGAAASGERFVPEEISFSLQEVRRRADDSSLLLRWLSVRLLDAGGRAGSPKNPLTR